MCKLSQKWSNVQEGWTKYIIWNNINYYENFNQSGLKTLAKLYTFRTNLTKQELEHIYQLI